MQHLEIQAIQARGSAREEYVRLCVRHHCNLRNYLLLDTTFTPGGDRSNRMRHLFWFPDHPVMAGDEVWPHTGKGSDRRECHPEGGQRHHFHWNLNQSVWNDRADEAMLLLIADWQSYST